MKSIVIHILSLLLVVSAVNLKAQTSTENTSSQEFKKVAVGIFLVDVLKIDDANQIMNLDFIVRYTWHDKKLAGKFKDGQIVSPEEIWTPQFQIINAKEMQIKGKDFLQVDQDGSVLYRKWYSGQISTTMNFKDFPFDEQSYKIELVSTTQDSILLVIDESFTGQMEHFSIADWQVGQGSISIKPMEVLSYNLASCSYEFQAERKIVYYIWKIIVPYILIVFMSWTVFWIDPVHISAQLAVASTAMLTMIAYQFTLSLLVPPLSYLTRLDQFMLGSYFMVFFALIESVITSNLSERKKMKRARRIDKLARYISFTLYFLIMIIAFWL
jgi:hypothetical protein